MTFDPTKPVQTRDGRKARIVCTDVEGDFPVLAIVNDGEHPIPQLYTSQGRFFKSGDSSFDLVNIPEQKSFWINLYLTNVQMSAGPFNIREEADKYRKSRTALLEIIHDDNNVVDVKLHKEEK